MDLSPSSLRRDDGPDPAIMLFGKRIQGPFTTGAAEIKERVLSPCGVDEQGVSFNGTTSSDEEENHSSSNPSVGTVAAAGKEVEQAGGKAKAMGSETAGEKAKAAEMMLARCPRCHSADTKFCYFNNYNVNQPRHFCKHCQRYWTAGGTLRNVPVGAGKRKSKHSVRQAFPAPVPADDDHSQPTNNNHRPFLRSVNTNLDLFAAGAQPNLHSGFSTEIRAPLPNLQFEPTELCIINRRNPQSGFLGLDDIKANPQSGLGKINPNLQIEFSVLREINTNLQSGFSRLGEIKANLQSGCSGLGIINANLESGFPGLCGIKANLQTGFHGLTEIEANLQSGFSGSGQNKANLQSGFSRLGEHNANLHIGRPEAKAFKLNSQSESHESSEMKDQVQASTSENKPSGCSVSRESNAHLTGEYNGFSRIKAPQVCFYRDEPHKTPHLCFHGDEPHLSLCSSEFTPVKSTDEGAFNKNSLLEKVSCHEAREGWCSGEVLPIVGAQWPCFYNMYWVDGMPQEALRAWPHFAPLLTPPQGWGMSCVGPMTPSILTAATAAAAPAPTMKVLTATTVAATTTTTTPPPAMLATPATIVAPNTTSAPPPPTMVATHLNLTDDVVATTILGKRNTQHKSMEEHDDFFYKSSKVCGSVEPSTTSSSSSNLITPGLITAIAQAPNSGGLNFWQ